LSHFKPTFRPGARGRGGPCHFLHKGYTQVNYGENELFRIVRHEIRHTPSRRDAQPPRCHFRPKNTTAAMACRVFISLRLCESNEWEINQLKEALEAAGISVFLCGATPVGGNIAADVANALNACELFLVLGTEHFGVQGDTNFSTRQELEFAVGHGKPIFLIKRCDEFKDPLTRMYCRPA
jgi:hypothetical protein